jgi:enoyl-[acyl-carrier protein] reductase I
MTDTPTPLMQGKRGLVMGVANDHSIAWGIARTLAAQGAEMAFTYQGDSFGKRVRPLAESVGSTLVLPADVQDADSLDTVFSTLESEWGGLDFLVHAIAYSDKNELKGRYVNTSRSNFLNTMDISCFSLTDLTNRAHPLMKDGGSIVTLTYLGAERVLPNYNVMGVAKAALEASVRYLAADLGPDGIRVNAISPGPMRTLAGSAVGSARKVYNFNAQNAPLRRTAALDEVGGAALFLLSDMGGGTTGETLYVDGGYHAMGMVAEENLG